MYSLVLIFFPCMSIEVWSIYYAFSLDISSYNSFGKNRASPFSLNRSTSKFLQLPTTFLDFLFHEQKSLNPSPWSLSSSLHWSCSKQAILILFILSTRSAFFIIFFPIKISAFQEANLMRTLVRVNSKCTNDARISYQIRLCYGWITLFLAWLVWHWIFHI